MNWLAHNNLPYLLVLKSGVISLNRYSYVLNNSLKYTDPSGHAHWAGEGGDSTSIWAEYHNNGWSDHWSYGQVKAAYSNAQIAAANAPAGHDPHAVFADTMADALQERGTANWGTTRMSALAWSHGDEWWDITAVEGGREQAMFVATNSLFTPGPAIAGSGADGGTFPGEEYKLNTSYARSEKVAQIADKIQEWLGGVMQPKSSRHGEPVFLSQNGDRRMRVDFSHTYPHNNPHLHLEYKNETGKWIKPGPIFPSDVPHN